MNGVGFNHVTAQRAKDVPAFLFRNVLDFITHDFKGLPDTRLGSSRAGKTVNFSPKKAQNAQKISGPYLSFLCLFVAKIAFASLVHAQSTDLPKWVKEVGARRAPKAKRTCLVNAAGDGVANSTKAIQRRSTIARSQAEDRYVQTR